VTEGKATSDDDTIRRFTEADRPSVKKLWHDCGLVRPWNDPDTDIDTCLDTGHGDLLVLQRGGDVIGTVMVGHDGHRGWVYYLAIAPAARRGGCGRILMDAAEAWVRARGIRKLQLMVRSENRSVIDFYRSAGYQHGDVVLMQRWLDGTTP